MDKFELGLFLPFRIARIASEISSHLSVSYQENLNLSTAEWRVMATLSAYPVVTANFIVASTFTHKSTISRAVKSLERREWVERIVVDGDRRNYDIQFTKNGSREFYKLVPLILKRENELEKRLDDASMNKIRQTLDLLEKMLDIPH